MAEVKRSPLATGGQASASGTAQVRSLVKQNKTPLNQIYSRPLPIRTFPLPSYATWSNPVSWIHIAYIWLVQALFPKPAEPSVILQGFWSVETQSVHVTDTIAIRVLWEQGFFGKGNLSRSEPNWLKRAQIRQGLADGKVSEEVTNTRREERMLAKWERARLEQEAIERTRQEEAFLEASKIQPQPAISGSRESATPPIGPLELLALPNSALDAVLASQTAGKTRSNSGPNVPNPSRRDGSYLTSLPMEASAASGNAFVDAASHLAEGLDSGLSQSYSERPPSSGDDKLLKRQKSVRFSPQVESATFQSMDPPSPSRHTSTLAKPSSSILSHGASSKSDPGRNSLHATPELSPGLDPPETRTRASEIQNKEHSQLSPEEAFYLVFGLGVLSVTDPTTRTRLAAEELLLLFCGQPYLPSPAVPQPVRVRPDDPFIVQYSVYHHFRSLGWVVRPGIKFGVDWMLYFRGPVFDHAEFGVIILPSYSDPSWKRNDRRPSSERSWHWLHGINRVMSHVVKTLVLVYVDIPSPCTFAEAYNHPEGGVAAALREYKVMEIVLRRWSGNRNR